MDAMQQTQQAESQGPVLGERKGITCDQVAWMLNAINRHLPPNNHPAVSRAREMQGYALLYELMEVAGLKFADERARHNGTPPDARWDEKALCASNKTSERLNLGRQEASREPWRDLIVGAHPSASSGY